MASCYGVDRGFNLLFMNELAERKHAKHLYFKGYSVNQISELLQLKKATVSSWKARECWDDEPVVKRVESAMEFRFCQLIEKEIKDSADYKELEQLTKLLERTTKIVKYSQTGNGKELNPKLSKRREGKTNQAKNELDEEAIEKLETAFQNNLFGYQKEWSKAKSKYRIRNILKSRQIGATWYFAREAILDAAITGDNQIFLSASKAQAHVFKNYIIDFVRDATGVELKGDPMILPNGATLYFLGTSARTAQSYHGHLYLDEYFWIHRFQEFRKVTSGMAIHKKWRQTYFSTPSTLNHEAHPFWSGALFNKGRKKADRIDFDISHSKLKKGFKGGDGQWRNIVTVEDAVETGCNLFDLDQLRLEYNEQEYDNLLMCQFVDDAASIFKLSELQACMVDSWEVWEDFSALAIRPFANQKVWVGYDPSRSGDDASCVVLAPPAVPGGKFRVLERHSWNNIDFETQSNHIRNVCNKYNVEHIAIDTSGIGYGVFELVKKFFPAVTAIQYSLEVKTKLVLKARQIISRRRLEFDAGQTDIAMAFMTVHQTTTPSGLITYAASRTSETGHADIAWALMHALYKEPLTTSDETGGGSQSIMEIY